MTSEDVLAVIRKQIRHSPVVADLRGRADELRDRADELTTRASVLTARADDLVGRADGIDARAGQAEGRLAALETITRFRTVIVSLPLLAAGATEITVDWPVAFGGNDYGVTCTLEAGNVALGRITAGLKANSRGLAGCVVTVTNSAAVAVPAGAQLHVLGWRTPAGP